MQQCSSLCCLLLSVSEDRDSITSLGNVICFKVCPLPFVITPCTLKKNLTPSQHVSSQHVTYRCRHQFFSQLCLLRAKQGLSSLSISFCVMCSSPQIILVALHWSCSRLSAHFTPWHFRPVLVSDEQRGRIICLGWQLCSANIAGSLTLVASLVFRLLMPQLFTCLFENYHKKHIKIELKL